MFSKCIKFSPNGRVYPLRIIIIKIWKNKANIKTLINISNSFSIFNFFSFIIILKRILKHKFAYKKKHSLMHYTAPFEINTGGKVINNILKSNHKDQLSIYCKSSLAHSLKSEILFLPYVCQIQVIPGCTLNLLLCH